MINAPDYYTFLQISPSAEPETIHRVYRFLASRYHPDNPITGDLDKFQLLRTAYDVLSDADRRAQYDAMLRSAEPEPLSTTVDFMDDLEGELNRRLAVLVVLYLQRRKDTMRPNVSFLDLEKRMGFPRDYLEFAIWYLETKKFISRMDNGSFAITACGVDFVEEQRGSLPLLRKLLTEGEQMAREQAAAE